MARRPDRSDQSLPPEEAARIEAEVRDYFEKVAPKRHSKPPRSDPSDPYSDSLVSSDPDLIPELDKLRRLESDPQRLVVDGGEVVEEYVETEYYDGINCIDKQHHTTGSGFIKVEKPNKPAFDAQTVSYTSCVSNGCYRSNPATNDWIPSTETVIPISTKPNRSES
ncbi:Maternal effect embryo arrest 59 [Rhynchospora pubera]|uniref:Maternal effect embryo arrest 59 n=1 Tax=Rhynchospora pubera TaxID=906938 RepID=A0AAV8FZW3_9POAL|nr:Maternal effect embryo arrest 59 [Rhynchospora pubera]